MFAKSLPLDARVKKYRQVALFRLVWPEPQQPLSVRVCKVPVDGLEGGVDEGGTGGRDEAEDGEDPAHLLLAHALARHRPGLTCYKVNIGYSDTIAYGGNSLLWKFATVTLSKIVTVTNMFYVFYPGQESRHEGQCFLLQKLRFLGRLWTDWDKNFGDL